MPQVTTNGVDTYYERMGEGTEHPVVFIHGLGIDHRTWRPQMEALAGEYDLVAYDYRAHGNTDATADQEYSIELLADDLHELIEELGLDSPVLCGHSYGGLIASEYAIQHPDGVSALVFADARTNFGETTSDRVMIRVQPILSGLETVVGRDRVRTVMNTIAKRLSDMEEAPDKEVSELGMTPSEYADDADESFVSDEVDKFLTAGKDYVGASPTDFHVPVLYAYGELSGDVFAGKADRLERAPTDVRVAEIENAGHGLMLQQPETFTATLRDFLEQTTATHKQVAGADA